MERASDKELPRRCGRYILIEELGGGGMAEVYKARLAQSEGPDRVLVVKLLPPNADPSAAARFIDEAKIALPLTHGNITATFEFGRADDRPFLVMEYVHGRSLRQLLEAFAERGEVISIAMGLFVAREVARALRYAHRFVADDGRRSPVIHRDVSPENVLISYSGQIKLTDFGIAKSAEALDIAGAWGKPAYVAPEILEGAAGDPRSDVYSLGCVLYEMLSGWPPLVGKSDEETLRMVREQTPPSLIELRDDVPPALSILLDAILLKRPQDRQIDAAQLEINLSQMLATEAPHFTEAEISTTLSRVIDAGRVSGGDLDDTLLAERLRDQLNEAGFETSGRESAADMLALGTVQLSSDPPAPMGDAVEPAGRTRDRADTTLKVEARAGGEERRRSIGPLVAFLIAALLLVVGAAVLSARWVFDGDAGDAGASAARGDADGPLRSALDAAAADRESGATDGGGARATRPDGASGDAAHAEDGGGEEPDATRTPRRPRRRWGTATFNSHPWSFVYVDGRKLPGHTPVRSVRLLAGPHRVRFVNPELGLSKSTSVRVRPSQESFVKVRLSKGAAQ